jgi:protein SCO1/2
MFKTHVRAHEEIVNNEHWYGDEAPLIVFISVTVDPERDTPEVLKEYAQAFGADPTGWFFVTGPPDFIRDVTRRYGVFASKAENGNIDHTFLTSIIDPRGILRVQGADP